MTRMRGFALFLVIAFMAAIPAARAENYVLQAEDLLTISVMDHPDFARDVVVLSDGYFHFPLAGRVAAAGKTPQQVAGILAKALEKECADPQVTVSVKQPAMRRVYISGLVGKAGSFDLKPGWRVSHLVAEAGGLMGNIDNRPGTPSALKPEYTRGTVVRRDENITVDLYRALALSDREADVLLLPGDLVQIQADTNLIHVVGQVRSPGDYQVKNRLGVLEAVAAAGGVTEKAALTRTQVIRGTEAITVDLRALLVDGKVDGNVALQAGDTLVIPTNEARIAVLGGVQSPGYFDLPDGKPVTVADAIGMARGANKRARLGEVALIRNENGKQTVAKLKFNDFIKKADESQNPTVKTGDVVYIPDGSSVDRDVLTANSSVTFATGLLFRLLFP